jgi:type III secretory pathway component EscV
MSNTLRTVAGAIGTAILVTIMSSKLKTHLAETLATGTVDPNNKTAMMAATADATIYGVNYAFTVATYMTIAALIMAFFIQKTKPATEPANAEKEKAKKVATA